MLKRILGYLLVIGALLILGLKPGNCFVMMLAVLMIGASTLTGVIPFNNSRRRYPYYRSSYGDYGHSHDSYSGDSGGSWSSSDSYSGDSGGDWGDSGDSGGDWGDSGDSGGDSSD